MRYFLLLSFGLFSITNALSQNTIDVFNNLTEAYEAQDYETILAIEKSKLSSLSTQEDSILAEIYFIVGEAYYNLDELKLAADYYEKERNLRKKLGFSGSKRYGDNLYNLVFLYSDLGDFRKAKEVGNELLLLDEATYGPDSEEYINSVLNYVDVLIKSTEYHEARQLLTQVVKYLEKNHPYYPFLMNKEADLFGITGNYDKAERKFIESLKLIERMYGAESAVYASSSSNLATFYSDQGKYTQAEELLLHALDVLKAQQEDERAGEDYISTLNNLALVHRRLNQLDKSISEFNEVLESDIQSYGENHPYVALTLSNMGITYNYAGHYDKSEEVLLKALEISGESLGKNSVAYALDANNLGTMYRLSGRPERALPLYQQAIAIQEKAMGKNDPDYLTFNHHLGLTYLALDQKSKAEKILNEVLRQRKSILGVHHAKYAESAEQLAYLYWSKADKKQAEKYFSNLFENYYHQIEEFFPALSEEEKVNFFIKKVKLAFEKYNNYVFQHYQKNEGLLDEMLDHQLNTKGLIMYATNKVRESIMSGGDSLLIKDYESWIAVKENLSRFYSAQNEDNSKAIDSLNKVAEDLEKELGRKSSAFTQTYLKERVSWKTIQKGLNEEEAVIEIIRFRTFDPQKGGRFTDDIKYVALIFTKDDEHPRLIEIPDGVLLENRYINNYRNAIQYQIQDNYSYDKLWKPIGENLKNVTRIYFSPDGVYNQVSINTLYNPETEKYLLDEIEVRVLTNSKDLLDNKFKKDSKNNKAFLLGYPNYNMYLDKTDSSSTRGGMRGATESLTRGMTRGMRAGLLRYMRGEEGITMLPGTKTEVENINQIFTAASLQPRIVLNNEATEHFVKSVSSPSTLHIATHGFFLQDVETNIHENMHVENPLLRSGLILAGAGDFLLTGQSVDASYQDGILTAYEAMNLNLDDTELVVLSACETGLGEIKNGEGVYGLQRAFMVAGADNLIMSMWSVDDDATQELMSIFYREWFKLGDKQLAFRKAQQLIRDKYSSPFYWGAFIMVGI